MTFHVNLYSNIASHYRKWLWTKLLCAKGVHLNIFYGDKGDTGIDEIDFSDPEFYQYKNRIKRIKNYWLSKKAVIWQKGVVSSCTKDQIDSAIFVGDMYCISTWIASIICRIRKIQVVFWGHGLYGSEGKLKLFVRKTFYQLAHKHLLYERKAKKLMIKQNFKKDDLYIVFNSLDYDTHCNLRSQFQNLTKADVFPFFVDPSLPVIVFIGRLTKVKKLKLLLEAAIQLNSESKNVNLVIIGDGPERVFLEKLAKDGLDEEWVYFTGSCYEEEIISRYVSKAELCVSPGNVGLTAIHSLSLGTPVATHNNMNNQMPEAEAITDGVNGFFFNENDVNDLKDKIQTWLTNKKDRAELRERCFKIIDQFYNPYYQLSTFNRLFNNKKPEI